jgi:hypothetical protein
MTEVGLALLRSIKTLGQGRVWLLVFGPAVLGLLVWVGLAVFSLEWLIASLVEQPPLSWLAGWGVLWLAKLAAALGGWLLILAAAFVTAMLLAAIFVMPLLLEVVSSTDYPELARLGKDSLAGAVCEQPGGGAGVYCRLAADPAVVADPRAGAAAAGALDGLADPSHLCLRRTGRARDG